MCSTSGCGTGVFLRLAADRGARVFGLDASEALLEVARKRVPEADLRAGDMEALPYEDNFFDVVAGFSSFFFAADMSAALRETRRVAKPRAPVVVQVWGSHERNDLEPMKEIARGFLPAPPPDAPAPPKLWQAGVLDAIAEEAGLTPQSAFDLSYPFEYRDEETLARELTAPMGLGALAGDREKEVRSQIVDALASHRRPDGSYRLDNELIWISTGSLFEQVWAQGGRIVAVQPHEDFLHYFQAASRCRKQGIRRGAKSGSDGSRGIVWHPIEIRTRWTHTDIAAR